MASKAPRQYPTPGSQHPCPECGGDLPERASKGRARVFCTAKCKADHNNRMASRGKALAKIALGWRVARGSGEAGRFLFSQMQEMLDAWNAEDNAAGRMRADDYAMLMVKGLGPSSERYMDRRVTRVHCDAQHSADCHGSSKTATGTTIETAQRMAENSGWGIDKDGAATCPACIEAMENGE